jgi:hypothetical protein
MNRSGERSGRSPETPATEGATMGLTDTVRTMPSQRNSRPTAPMRAVVDMRTVRALVVVSVPVAAAASWRARSTLGCYLVPGAIIGARIGTKPEGRFSPRTWSGRWPCSSPSSASSSWPTSRSRKG